MDAGAVERVTKTALADDGAIGLALLEALVPQVLSCGVVVVRRHVLAVETGEGLADLVARAAGRRQWGKSKKRRGALAVTALGDVNEAVITAAADAGYERIVAAEDAPGIAERARAAGLVVEVRGRDA
jgi:DUF1009 family protein